MPDESSIVSAKRHCHSLDLLRGVAAIFVVMFHFSTRLDLGELFSHSYLAVDFFFMLSGLVIDRAYASRLQTSKLSFIGFATLRVIRLWPLVLLGTAVAAVIDLGRPGDFTQRQHVQDIIVTSLLGCLCLPTLWSTTLEQTTYPLNGPVWSLFFELAANLCVVPIYRSKQLRKLLIAVAVVSLLMLLWISEQTGDIHLGTHSRTFLWGFPRVFWSFAVGILLSRSKLPVPRISIWLYVLVLACVLSCPPPPAAFKREYDLVVVTMVWPAVLAGAAVSELPTKLTAFARRCGDLSYPVYILHYALVRVLAAVARKLDAPIVVNYLLALASTALIVLVAAITLKVFDEPLRAWLTRLSAKSSRRGYSLQDDH